MYPYNEYYYERKSFGIPELYVYKVLLRSFLLIWPLKNVLISKINGISISSMLYVPSKIYGSDQSTWVFLNGSYGGDSN